MTPIALSVLGMLALATSVQPDPAAQTEKFQDLLKIQAIAERYVTTNMTPAGSKMKAVAQRLDPRLRLRSCDQPLSASATLAARNSQMTSVKVACEGSSPWQLYVSVRVRAYQRVVVLKTHLARGKVLSADMLGYEERELSAGVQDWFVDIAEATGKSSRRSVIAGSVLKSSDLKDTQSIKRGQSLRLISRHGSIEVSTNGKALENGSIGSRLRVVNIKTGKQLEGQVIDKLTVLIN